MCADGAGGGKNEDIPRLQEVIPPCQVCPCPDIEAHVVMGCPGCLHVRPGCTRTAKTPLLTHLLRCLSFFSAIYSFYFSTLHIPGVLNVAADALSRNRMSLFCSLVPQTQQFLIPPALSALLLSTMPDWGSPSWTQLFTRCLAEVSPHPQ